MTEKIEELEELTDRLFQQGRLDSVGRRLLEEKIEESKEDDSDGGECNMMSEQEMELTTKELQKINFYLEASKETNLSGLQLEDCKRIQDKIDSMIDEEDED